MDAVTKLKLVPGPTTPNDASSGKGVPEKQPVALSISLDEVLVHLPDNIRGEYDPESISRLARELREQGQLQSVLVEPLTEPGPRGERYRLVAGYRRYLAAREASIPRLFAIVREFPDGGAMAANAAENIEREQVSLYDIVRRIRDLLAQKWSVERIMRETGADPALTPRLVYILQECAPQLIDQIRYDESSKTLSRLDWAARNIKGITREQKFQKQIEWWKQRTAEGWRNTESGTKHKPKSASPERIRDVGERIRAARGLHGPGGWVALSETQAEAVANALAWCASPKGGKSPI